MKMKRFLTVVFSLLLLLAFIGCSHDDNNSSVTNPNPDTSTPTGYVAGVVRDACTLAPIEGAVVDIGVAKATTAADGTYTLKDVPATTYIDATTYDVNLDVDEMFDLDINGDGKIDSGWRGHYTAVITMTNAKVDGAAVTGYAKTYYDRLSVAFASTEPSSGILSADNADVTMIEGLGNSQVFDIGKLGSTITGKAVYAATYKAVPAGLTVYLINREKSGNSSSGNVGNIVKSTLTQADGTFVLTGVENNQDFSLYVTDNAANPSLAGYLSYNEITTGCNTATPAGLVLVKSTDELCPFIASTSPVMYTDVSSNTGTAGLNVVLTFSEAIKATPYNTGNALTASPYYPGLYDDIGVYYVGNKAGDIQHTFSWSADMTQLTINIPTEAVGPAAIYQIWITNNRYLTDASGNPLSLAPDLSGTFTCATSGTNLGIVDTFSTYGAIEAGAISDLKIRANMLLDYNDIPALDWTAVVGAKSYNTYCQLIQWPVNTTCDICDPNNCTTTGGQAHPYTLVQSGDFTGGYLWNGQPWNGLWLLWNNIFGTDNYFGYPGGDFIFVEDFQIKLSYRCYVRGVDADGVEGPASNIVTLEDVVAPTANYESYTTGLVTVNTAQVTVVTSIEVCFDEPMNEKLVETIANWSVVAGAWSTSPIAVPTISSIDYVAAPLGPGSWCATIYLGTGGIPSGTYTAIAPGYGVIPNAASTTGLQDVGGNKLATPITNF